MKSFDLCNPCGLGKFSLGGQKRCDSCTGKTYSDETSASVCKNCPTGFLVASEGKNCQPIPIDSTLPIPTSIAIQRATSTSYTQLEIDWICDDMALISSFTVTLSISPIFKPGNTTTKVYENVLSAPFFVPTIMNLDLRSVPHYVKVQVVGKGLFQVGGESAPSIKWRNTGEKDQSCSLSTQFLNSTSLNPMDWECAKCPPGASCAGSVAAGETNLMFVSLILFLDCSCY